MAIELNILTQCAKGLTALGQSASGVGGLARRGGGRDDGAKEHQSVGEKKDVKKEQMRASLRRQQLEQANKCR